MTARRRAAKSVTIPRVLLATAGVAALGLMLLSRSPSDTSPGAAQRDPPPARASTDDLPEQAIAPEALANPAAAKLHELQGMSETFRNTTFLIAIRDAGYLCSDLLEVFGGVNNSATWTATCRGMLAYTVKVDATGALRVDPTVQFLDSLTPVPESLPQRR